MEQPKTLRLADYRRPSFTTEHVNLDFDIRDSHTTCVSKVKYERTGEGAGETILSLNCENPNPAGKPYVKKVTMNGIELAPGTGYTIDEKNKTLDLVIDPSENEIDLEIETYLEPENNKALSGLYKSDSTYVTQCESEGFRRITPFLDRPDVMAKYTVRVEADEKTVPVLMANGNTVSTGKTGTGRHWAVFEDPWAKPCYLFATANGNLECLEDTFTTMSGRNVNVRMYTEAGESAKGRHALDALKLSMKWDEDVFGCEYDLDNFNVVAVAKFNFGAMENKGLNVFRDSLIMANPTIATDDNYQRITDVIGHEYFHNYSGNRVTVANWFNISLKEGLTVIREQMFTAFTTSDATQRIGAVKTLRAGQFVTDDSPLAHPVMPQEVQSVENCYTSTIYEKGAEVIRMMKTMMGEKKFTDGVKDYFKTNDGQAVTINEFVRSMEKVSGLDLSGQFSLWYTQSGRPRVTAHGVYDPAAKTYTLTLEQTVPPTKDQPVKKPMVIPVEAALVNDNGSDIAGTNKVLVLDKPKQTFVFDNVPVEPAFHSLLRGMSAPVDIDPGLTEDQLHKQLLTDPDGFNRWDAGQKIALTEMKRLYNGLVQTGTLPGVSQRYLDTLKLLVTDTTADPALVALAITPPGIKELEGAVQPANPSAINAVRKHLRETIATALAPEWEAVLKRTHDGQSYMFDHNKVKETYEQVGKRKLKAIAVGYLTETGDAAQLKRTRDMYFAADNMTDQMIAMGTLADHKSADREAVFDDFFKRFKDDQLTIQKWFSMQAYSDFDGVIDKLKDITGKPYFSWENPGHVGSAIGGFAGNYAQFHRKDGKGYEYTADSVIKMDKISPNISSRLVEPLCRWRSYTPDHGQQMVAQLERIAKTPGLSTGVKEKLLKSLPDAGERKTLGFAPQP
jgi:aminopeptidase N